MKHPPDMPPGGWPPTGQAWCVLRVLARGPEDHHFTVHRHRTELWVIEGETKGAGEEVILQPLHLATFGDGLLEDHIPVRVGRPEGELHRNQVSRIVNDVP